MTAPGEVDDPRILIPMQRTPYEAMQEASVPMATDAEVGDTVALVPTGDPAMPYAAAPMRVPEVGETVVLVPIANPNGGIRYLGIPTAKVAVPPTFDYPIDIYNVTNGNRVPQLRWYHGDDEAECITTPTDYGFSKKYYLGGASSDPVVDIRIVTKGKPPGVCDVWFCYSGGTANHPTYPVLVNWQHDYFFFRIGGKEVFICMNPLTTYPDSDGVYAATVRYQPPFDLAPVGGDGPWSNVVSSGGAFTYGLQELGAYARAGTYPFPALKTGFATVQVLSDYNAGTWTWGGEFTDRVTATGLRGTLYIARVQYGSGMDAGVIRGLVSATVKVNGVVVATVSGDFGTGYNAVYYLETVFDVNFPTPITNPTIRIEMQMSGYRLIRGPAWIWANLWGPAWKV